MIRLEKEEESAAGRLMPWLRIAVPASAPPPKTTATDHWRVSVQRSRSDYRETVPSGTRVSKRWKNLATKGQTDGRLTARVVGLLAYERA